MRHVDIYRKGPGQVLCVRIEGQCPSERATLRAIPLFRDVEYGLTKELNRPSARQSQSVELHDRLSHLVDERLDRGIHYVGEFRRWSKDGYSDQALLGAICYLCKTRGQAITRLLVEADAHLTGASSTTKTVESIHQPTRRPVVAWVVLQDQYTLQLTGEGAWDVRLPTLDIEKGFDRASPSSNWAFQQWRTRFDVTKGRSWDAPIFPTSVKGVFTYDIRDEWHGHDRLVKFVDHKDNRLPRSE